MRQSSCTSGVWRVAPTVQIAAPTPARGGISRFFAPAALLVLLALTAVVIATAGPGAGTHPNSASSAHAGARKLAPYWTVHPGDTLAQISYKTGLTVGQLEAYNPNVDPQSLVLGDRLNLWAHPPVPRLPPAKPLGPLFWTVRVGQSFGSIAAATGINLARL